MYTHQSFANITKSIAVILTLALAGWTTAISGATAPSTTFIRASNDFAFDYYRHTASTETSNFCFSPLSLSEAFGMLYPGTKGVTASELATVFHFDTNTATLVQSYNQLNGWLNAQKLASGGEMNFGLANGIWLQKGFPFEQSYLDLVTAPFEAALQTVDFGVNPAAERTAINSWVSERTGERIKELFPAGSISEATRFVLVNALYFKSAWEVKFKPESTRLRPFFQSDGTTLYVPTMSGEPVVGLYNDSKLIAVENNFEGNKFSLLMLMPQPGSSLAEMESTLTGTKLEQIVAGLEDTWVYLSMPRFSIDTDIDLIPELQSMGMNAVFNPSVADLTGLSPLGKQLYVGTAVHKATITVNEYGVEAAAATGIVGEWASGPSSFLFVNRSFLYLLREKESGAILFVGRMEVPETSISEADRLQLAQLTVKGFFDGQLGVSGWVTQTFMGDLYTSAYPWLYHTGWGWFYPFLGVDGSTWAGFWFWQPESGWYYTRQSWYPFAWNANDGVWYWNQTRLE
ncbi:MAG: serpin family protein [Verrucomicrobiota bacterium]|nr:serpin family protein [Verrucomicrobiota bacterium]